MTTKLDGKEGIIINIDQIIQKIEAAEMDPYFVFISGGSCTGKTFLAKLLMSGLENQTTLIEMDDYFKDKDDVTLPMFGGRLSFDLPTSYCLDDLKKDLDDLMQHKQITMPIYDINCNRRIDKKAMEGKKIIIVEGLYASMVSDIIEKDKQKITILMRASSKTRLERRIKRDTARFSWSEKAIENYFYSFIEPIDKMYISKQKATMIIEN